VELSGVDAMLDRLDAGTTGLVLTGDAGIGKSTVWAEGLARACERGLRVLVTRAAEAEAPLSYAGLSDLIATVPADARSRLPEPQRRALAAALLEEPPPERGIDERAVGAAMLGLVRTLADERPLVLAVDDAQWLDSPTLRSLTFAGRRLDGERVGFLLAERTDSGRRGSFEGVLARERMRTIELAGLSVAGLHSLFTLHLGHSFPRPHLVRIGQASDGNPFYALELARTLAGRRLEPGRLPVAATLGTLVEDRLGRLPPETREVLLVAAALAKPDVELIDAEALAPAEAAGIAVVERGRVRFVHPIYASAVYWGASEPTRRTLHRRLAGLVSDAEQRARHLALGCMGPDETVAEALDRAVSAAAARGAPSSAAELAALSVELTPDGAEELSRRRLTLARHLFETGATREASAAFGAAAHDAPPGMLRAEATFRLGWLELLEGNRANGTRLMEAALEWASEPALAGRIHAVLADPRRTDLTSAIEHGERALALLDPGEDPGPYASTLQLVAEANVLAGNGADLELVERSLRLLPETSPWELNHVAGAWAAGLDDFATARGRYRQLYDVYQAGGGPDGWLPSGLARMATLEVWTGHWPEAERRAREALELAEETEQPVSACLARYPLGLVFAHRGAVEETRAAAEASLAFLGDRPEPILRVQVAAVIGFLELSLGNHAAAAAVLEHADAQLEMLGWREPFTFRHSGDRVEALVALGRLDEAGRLVERLDERAAAVPRPWVTGVAARGRALTLAAAGDLDGSLASVTAAAAAHEELDMPFERARTLLVLGAVRRRRKERRLARESLERARALFAELGAPLWLARAEAELGRAAARKASGGLTPTEERVARLAASGLTNRAIAEQAFVSVKTVEANLARVYRKLAIGSRAQLGRALEERAAAEPARHLS
jgi:DNA-binding CsgD family transcriptional regulator